MDITGLVALPLMAAFSPILGISLIMQGDYSRGIKFIAMSPILVPLGICTSCLLYPPIFIQSLMDEKERKKKEREDKRSPQREQVFSQSENRFEDEHDPAPAEPSVPEVNIDRIDEIS